MSYENRHETTIEQSLEKLRDKLCVYGAKDLKKEWDKAIGISPDLFYNTLTKDLPEKSEIYLDFNGGGDEEFSIKSEQLSAEHCFSKHHKTLELKEIRIEESFRRKGLGKTLLENYINFSKLLGIETINGRAGREDGEFFWSKRGGVLQDCQKLKNQFIEKVKLNAAELKEKIGEETLRTIDIILMKNDVQMNFNLASMKEKIDSVPIGVALLKGTNPRVSFNLNDKEQMKNILMNLK